MTLRRTLGLIFLLLFLTHCAKKEKEPLLNKGIAIITGKIINKGENSRTIRFAAGSTVEDIERTAIIDSNGNFRLEIELYHPQNIQGFFKKGIIVLYLRPHDSIHLEINGALIKKENFSNYKISGTKPDSEISQEIQQYLQYRGKITFNPQAREKSVKEYLQILHQEIFRQDSILQEFSKENNASKEFQNWARKNNIYRIANYLIDYKIFHPDYKTNLFDTLLFPVNDDSAIITSPYPLHLKHYAINIGWKDTVALNLLKQKDYVEAYQKCLNNILNSTSVKSIIKRRIKTL